LITDNAQPIQRFHGDTLGAVWWLSEASSQLAVSIAEMHFRMIAEAVFPPTVLIIIQAWL